MGTIWQLRLDEMKHQEWDFLGEILIKNHQQTSHVEQIWRFTCVIYDHTMGFIRKNGAYPGSHQQFNHALTNTAVCLDWYQSWFMNKWAKS